MKKIHVVVFFLVTVGILTVSMADNKIEEAKKLYNEGLKYYLKRDFKNASQEWNKALLLDNENEKIKEYLDKAQSKYYESLQLFFQGLDDFKRGNYPAAEKAFQDSLLINPLDEKAMYYLRLCSVPKVELANTDPVVTANQTFEITSSINKETTVPDWIEKWELDFFDSKKKIKTITGLLDPPSKLTVDLRDIAETLSETEKIDYSMTLISIYGRTHIVSTNFIKTDNKGPEITVSSPSNFSPDTLTGQSNKLNISFNVKDKSGLTNVILQIYNESQDRMLGSFPIKNLNNFLWDAHIADGSRISGGTVIYYRIKAIDRLMNESQSPFKRVSTSIVLQKREDNTVAMNLPNIEFEFGKANLLKSSFTILNRVGAILTAYSNSKFAIEGHTDNIGSKDRNIILSKMRAESVSKYLQDHFNLGNDRMIIKGYGDSKPKFPNNTEENRKRNRRVEVVILNQ